MNWVIPTTAGISFVVLWALKRKSLVSERMARQLLQQGALVVDVRQPDEFRDSHVVRALNIPLGDLERRLPRHARDKQQMLLVHCLSGGRSATAKRNLQAMGYMNVYNLGSLARAKKIVSGCSRDNTQSGRP
jgi:phage shock protein E